MKKRGIYCSLFFNLFVIYNLKYMLYALEIDWNSYVDDSLSQAASILASNAVLTVQSLLSTGPYIRHIDWSSLAIIYIRVKKMRNRYTNLLDKIDDKLPDEGEEPRPGMSQDLIEHYDNMRNEGYRLLEMGDAKLRTFNWDSITSDSIIPTHQEAVNLLMTVCEYQLIV